MYCEKIKHIEERFPDFGKFPFDLGSIKPHAVSPSKLPLHIYNR